MPIKIPFNKPFLTGNETKYITESINSGWTSGNGPFTKIVQKIIETKLEKKSKVLLTTSCTHALEMCAILLDLHPGDEVIVPSFTFVSTALAFSMHGANIVFADIHSDTLNIDEKKIEPLISSKTKAIVVVHYAGVASHMDKIVQLANKYKIVVIEDNAHGFTGKYKDKYLGTIGHLGTLSFHETKNISCGEGGALIINDQKYFERAEIIQEKGTNRSKFCRGEIEKYTWVDKGSSYVMSDLLAAFLKAQIEHIQLIQNKRKELWNKYYENLKQWAINNRVSLPYVPDYCEQAYHMFYLLMPTPEYRDYFIDKMKQNGISCVFHYIPLHTSKMAQNVSHKQHDCSISSNISNRIVRLPFYNDMTNLIQEQIIDHILKVQFQSIRLR